MKTCENCGSAVYSLGCTWCNEVAYIEQQECFDALNERDRKRETISKHVAAIAAAMGKEANND